MVADFLHIRTALLAVAIASACALVLAMAPVALGARVCASAGATPGEVGKRTMVRATLCILNAERVRHGLRTLRADRRLSEAADLHARDMARRRYFSHVSLDGSTFVDRIRRTGYLNGARSWTLGENLAWGVGRRSSPRAILAAWMASDGHRANILSRSFRDIGIGIAYAAPVPDGGRPAATFATDFGARG